MRDSVSMSVCIRPATVADAPAIARIGGPGMLEQYAGLVDPAAVRAAVDQLYTHEALAATIARCADADGARFLVAHGRGR